MPFRLICSTHNLPLEKKCQGLDNAPRMTNQKSTKIVATIGPATETEDTIRELILAGMNVARFNTKHGVPTWHHERIARVKKVAKELNVPIGILVDLQGPEIRISLPNETPIPVETHEVLLFASDPDHEEKTVIIPQEVIDAEEVGNVLLVDDGLGEFIIVAKEEHALITEVQNTCTIGHRKSLNTPGVVIAMPSLVAQDYEHLDAATNETVDFVGLSFVRNAQDIRILRDELEKRHLDLDVVAKIENQAALDNIDEIIQASDVVMVARGDLGVEVPYEQLTHWQKTIIQKCREHAKPVITATQMLKTMVDFPYPSRAEVSDVANAVYDGTDAVMLSEETTIGKYPVKAVATQTKICSYNEQFASPNEISTHDFDASRSVTYAAGMLLDKEHPDHNLQVDAVICLSQSGATAKQLSRFRKFAHINVFTDSIHTYHKLSIVYGVSAYVVELESDILSNSTELINKALELGVVESGQIVLILHGDVWKEAGATDSMKIITVP
ncbi:MAG: pyruvate kinase [Candidatus Pacebacteria bacterium CG_4_10_14_0_8_um_filter_42_14]|nr:MAG: pyruvate kinase [Candidatus Pacebacteria bacterium CG_4_10_14_0_8_um_filter_42_14]